MGIYPVAKRQTSIFPKHAWNTQISIGAISDNPICTKRFEISKAIKCPQHRFYSYDILCRSLRHATMRKDWFIRRCFDRLHWKYKHLRKGCQPERSVDWRAFLKALRADFKTHNRTERRPFQLFLHCVQNLAGSEIHQGIPLVVLIDLRAVSITK